MTKVRGATIAAMGWMLIAASCAQGEADGTTLPVIPPPPVVPLTIAVSPAGQRTIVQAGQEAAPGAVTVTVAGDGAAAAPWSAVARSSRTRIEGTGGTGSGLLRWERQTSGLLPGTWVDTIDIQLGTAGASAMVIDSISITAAPVPRTASITPTSRRIALVEGAAAPTDSALLALAGTGSETTTWSATARRAWTVLGASTGTGSAVIRWQRTGALPGPGTWVDTITITIPGVTGSPLRVLDSLVVTAPPPPVGARPDLGLNASFRGLRLFPAGDLWNQPVDTAQVDPNSGAILAAIGLGKNLHPDFGASYNGGPFGIPYIVVPDATARTAVTFDYASESDLGPYPIPANPPIEPSGDKHLLVVTQQEFKLYELFLLNGGPGAWTAGSGAIFDLTTGTERPAGWTSADAAGLPILPGLVRYDEVYELGEIRHALRFTVSRSRRAYVPPARHWASSSTDPLRAPMGMRVRLKASYDISGFSPPVQVILRALKTYGMIVADNGSDFFLSGTADARWNDALNNTLKQVKVGDFEVVKMVGVVTP